MTEDEKKAAKYRQEAKTGGTNAPVPQSAIQEAADKRLKKKPSKLQPLRQKWAKSLPRAVQLPVVLMVALSKARPVGR